MPKVDVFRKDGSQLTPVGEADVNQEIVQLLQSDTLLYSSNRIEVSGSLRSVVTGSNALHYIVWEHFNPEAQVPQGHYLGHRDTDINNNRIENLVVLDDSTKSAIAPRRRDNTTGFKDVFANREGYKVEVTCGGKSRYSGGYDTISEAAYAVNHAYSLLYRELPPPNRIPADALTDAQKKRVEMTVQRLFRPGRLPNQP